ncbi:prenylcysteine lyase family protein [Halanaeroarchaeum sulfurireducens]|uniref:Prenylcysteine lyase domain-containing protein n=1 Tax=Halanaeroarchaeum sulfurireducens TaxID=1604004 RepID=A0A0F7PBX5_9EURY|nr:prenylcysteine lyase family protein [Halanaeroarchaeum sulfurireducens]AKH97640.1 hypothetical protein HLASF_1152 [Halanaeroarchaeum sulfurireducens]ALG82035.1 hypothetical protein HLASA_1140 [Halanaeroarchaeum sulfurireducens]
MTGSDSGRIGIVGAGITGAATAYFVSQDRSAADVVVFERNEDVGGRLQTATIGDRTFEIGGKYLHTDDPFCMGFVEEFDLNRADPLDVTGSDPPAMGRETTIGIWDGESFAVNLEDSLFSSVGHLLGSYPLSLYRLFQEGSALEEQLGELSEQIAAGESVRTVTELTEKWGMGDWCRRTAREQLTDAGIAEQCIEEVLAATTQTTLGQEPSIHAFGGLYGFLSMGASGGDPFAIEGGNATLVETLLDESAADVETETAVQTIERETDGYRIHHDDGTTAVDAAVLAAPYERTDLTFDGVDAPPERPYHTNHLSFVAGTLDTNYFGTESIPDLVAAADDPDVPFTLLASMGSVEGVPGTLYELETPTEPTKDLLSRLFTSYEVVASKSWQGFPRFDPGIDRPPFELADQLYYPNAIESLMTSMEFSALAGRNTATLISDANV